MTAKLKIEIETVRELRGFLIRVLKITSHECAETEEQLTPFKEASMQGES